MEKVVGEVTKALSKDIEKIEPTLNMKITQAIEQCFSKSGSNSDRFADCVLSSNKKAKNILESFQLKLLFIAKSSEKCLQSKNQSTCIEQMTAIGANIVQNMFKDLEKV